MTVIPLRSGTDPAATGETRAVREPAVYTVPEVAELLDVGRNTVYEMLRAGTIPARKMGDRWIISRRRFHAWLDGDDQATAKAQGGDR